MDKSKYKYMKCPNVIWKHYFIPFTAKEQAKRMVRDISLIVKIYYDAILKLHELVKKYDK